MCEKEKVCTSSGLKDTLHIRMLHLQKEKRQWWELFPHWQETSCLVDRALRSTAPLFQGLIGETSADAENQQLKARKSADARKLGFRVEHAAAEQRRVWIFIFVQAEVTWAEESSASHLSHIQVLNLTTVKGCIIISCCRWLHLSAAKVMLLL